MPKLGPTFKDTFGSDPLGTGSVLNRGATPEANAVALTNRDNLTSLGGFGTSVEAINRSLRAMLEESGRIGNQNDANRAQATNFLMGQFDQNSKATITENDINTLFAQQADLSANDFLANNNAISESLGIRGVTGGVAADLSAQSHASFQQALAQSKGNIRIAKIQSDFQDSVRNLNAAQGISNFIASPVDETFLTGIGSFTDAQFALGDRGEADFLARKARGAAGKAAKLAAFGGIAKGALGLLGG